MTTRLHPVAGPTSTTGTPQYWYPVLTHPGAGEGPWFVMDREGLVRRFHGHPMGPSTLPSFYVVDAVAYTTGDDETRFCSAGIPWFGIVDSMICPGEEHPEGPSRVALYQQRGDGGPAAADNDRTEQLMSREEDLLTACIEFADTFVDDFDIVTSAQRLANRCVALVETSGAGIMLADRDGALCYVAASSEPMRLIDLFELEHHEGPNLDAYQTGVAAHRSMSDSGANDWPRFATRARAAGFGSASVLPMRLRSDMIGTLSLFSSNEEPLEPSEQVLVQALADIATIGILQQRALSDGRVAVSQLEDALDSRIVIEQAKGILAERLGVTIDAAFTLLRSYARSHNAPIHKIAGEVVGGALSADAITVATIGGRRRR